MDVNALWSWGERQAMKRGCSLWELLDTIHLGPPDEEWSDYWCTPINADPCAVTCLAGAHYATFEAEDGKSPVVLVVPDSFDRPCVVVGESLREFLCLGCEHGYGLVTGLAHQPRYTTEQLATPPDKMSVEEVELLSTLRREFDLRPWKEVGKRLNELQQLYVDQLDMPERSS